MISKLQKQEALANIKDKDLRMKISNILDKANKSEASYKVEATSFLNLSEKEYATKILNFLKVQYHVVFLNEYCEKSIIFFIPDYIEYDELEIKNYISCIKIEPKDMSKLKHKDFMGSIYNLGIKEEHLGDIFLNDKYGYVFVTQSVKDYILDNLFNVSSQQVICSDVQLDSIEIKNLKIDYLQKSYIIASRRVDALVAEVYNLGRKEAKDKIVAGDLCINAKTCINPAEDFNQGDIISFRRCGKFKVGEEIRTTKSGNICIKVYKYK